MWNNPKWLKMAMGAGVVGTLFMVGTGLRSTRRSPAFEQLSQEENAAVSRDQVLHVALSRMGVYATGDEDAHAALMNAVGQLMVITKADTANLRAAEMNLLIVKRSISKLRAATLSRTACNQEVMEEFEEVAQAVQNACADKLFNLHQAFTIYKTK